MRKSIFIFLAVGFLASCGGESKTSNTAGNTAGTALKSIDLNFKESPIKGDGYNTTIDGATVPDKLTLGEGPSLTLNGAWVRSKFRLKVYVAGLYLTEKSSNPIKIMDEDKPQAVRIHITSILMTSDNMTKYIIEGFERSTKGNTKPIQELINTAVKIFNSEPVRKNDIYDIFYIPEEKGIKAYKNGKYVTFIPGGVTFKKAILGIWLSDDPVDEDLKDGMLGTKQE